MMRALGKLFVTVALLATPAPSFGRVVQHGFAPRPVFIQPGFVHPSFANRGFINRGLVNSRFANRGFINQRFIPRGNLVNRRIFLAGPGVVVLPYPYYPYPYTVYPPCQCYVAPP